MKEFARTHKILVLCICIIFYLLFLFYAGEMLEPHIKLFSCSLSVIFIAITVFSCLKQKEKSKFETIAFCIIALGVILRAMYIAYTPITDRQHDVYDIQAQGHLGYIYTIYNTGKLPDTNDIQFYHPPLHHAVSAGWLKINQWIGIDFDKSLEGIQVLTAIYSSLLMVVVYCILTKVELKKLYKILLLGMIAFHPTFILLSGSINNDMLSIFLSILAILYVMKWQEEPSISNIILLAIITGCSVMTKVSSAIIAIPIGYIFLKKLWKAWKESKREFGKTILVLGLFAIISLPLGLWHPIRNKILFDQTLGGVLIPAQTYFIGNYTNISRFVTISLKQLFTTFCTVPGDYNLFAFMVKSSLFGEWELPIDFRLADTLKIFNIVLIVLSFIFMVVQIIKHKQRTNKTFSNLLLLYYFALMISYVVFNVQYPYTCTMDFRYIVPTIFIGTYFLLIGIERLNKGKLTKIAIIIEYSLIIFYLLSISIFYTMEIR